MRIETRDLTVRYPGLGHPALEGVSLGVGDGSLVVLGGPNGSGKTTVLRAVLGLLAPATGEVRIDGRPVSEWPRSELARRIGVVAQREESWLPVSVEEVVRMGRYPHLGPFAPLGRADREIVEQALERADVADLRHRPVETLSGGEWQRVRIARALAQTPQALVLDEPGTALDLRHEMEAMELVRSLVEDGMACLLITHHLNIAARYADQVVLLHRGRVAAQGPPGEVLTRELVGRVFDWPVAIAPWADGTPQIIPLRPGEG